MTDPQHVSDLGAERFVSLTTYRRNGEGVPTPVWVAPVDLGAAGTGLVVTTGASSGKVKRIRNNPEVALRPCSRRGRVADDAPTRTGRAEVLDDPATFAACTGAIRSKYGVEFRILMMIERLFSRGGAARVILRLTDT